MVRLANPAGSVGDVVVNKIAAVGEGLVGAWTEDGDAAAAVVGEDEEIFEPGLSTLDPLRTWGTGRLA